MWFGLRVRLKTKGVVFLLRYVTNLGNHVSHSLTKPMTADNHVIVTMTESERIRWSESQRHCSGCTSDTLSCYFRNARDCRWKECRVKAQVRKQCEHTHTLAFSKCSMFSGRTISLCTRRSLHVAAPFGVRMVHRTSRRAGADMLRRIWREQEDAFQNISLSLTALSEDYLLPNKGSQSRQAELRLWQSTRSTA